MVKHVLGHSVLMMKGKKSAFSCLPVARSFFSVPSRPLLLSTYSYAYYATRGPPRFWKNI